MPNPIINPVWTVDASYTVTDSDFLAIDVRLEDLGSEPSVIDLTVPAGGPCTSFATRWPGTSRSRSCSVWPGRSGPLRSETGR